MADKPKKKPQQDYQQLARKVLDSVIEKSGEGKRGVKGDSAPKRPRK